jgi:hypothetical protein
MQQMERCVNAITKHEPPLADAIGFYSERELDGQGLPSRVTRWRLRQDGKFPEPVQLSPGRVGYVKAEVLAWIQERIKTARGGNTLPEAARPTSSTAGEAT